MRSFLLICIVIAGCVTAPGEQLSGRRETDVNARQEVARALERLNSLVSARDEAIVDEFANLPDVLLLGSDAGELAIGRDQLHSLFRKLYSQPFEVSWEWKRTRISSAGNLAWLFAEGFVVIRTSGTEERAPYRMTGVLERRNGRWLWRQFHGSEPARR